MSTFINLGLSDNLLKAIDEIGYTTPTLIQEKAIPFVFMNRDILASAQTGTGKTASFTLPMMDILDGGTTKARMPRAIILEPTRELASQVSDNFIAYGKYNKLSAALIIGGTSMREQEKAIERGADVLIATPGRLLDLVERGKIMLNEAKMLVIDEADRMMDMGFIPDVEKLVSMMPRMRQTIMFSATFPNSIQKLAKQFLDNPKEIIVSPPASTSDNISQYVIHLDQKEKYRALRSLIKSEKVSTGIIFCNRKRDVGDIFNKMAKDGYSVGALHGDMEQSLRLQWLEKFRNGTVNLLVCSDVAARGLDIADVSHVFNIDVPMHSEDYVHRIGRTGRAGKLGTSFTFVSKMDKKLWTGVLNVIKKDVAEFKLNDSNSSNDSKSFNDSKQNIDKKPHNNESYKAKPKNEDSSKPKPTNDNKDYTKSKPNKRFDSQQGIGEITEEQSNKKFGDQDNLPPFLKG